MLALARALAREERGGDGLRRSHAGELVGQDRTHQAGAGIVRSTLDRRQAGRGLNDRIIDALVRVRPGLAEAVDGDVDDLRADGPNVRLGDPQPLDHARPEILG